MRVVSQHQVQRESGQLTLLVGLAIALYLAAAVGMAYVGGFGAVHDRLVAVDWPWLVVMIVGLAVSFGGYWLAYRGLERVEDGPALDERSLLAVVIAGFGGFLAHGGGALDHFSLKAAGADDREASVRVAAIAGLEHGVLGVGAWAAAIVVLALGFAKPPGDFTYPWAIIPPIGFAIAFWAAERYRERLRHREGFQRRLGVFLDSIHLVRELFRHPARNGWAVPGMGLFWAGDIFALYAGMAAFGFHMNVATLIVAAATGMIVTRRTGPLAGAGLMTVALVPTLWYSGAPWTAAMLGVAAYRFVSLFGPMPFSFAALPRLRALGEKAEETPGEGTREEEGEPALQH